MSKLTRALFPALLAMAVLLPVTTIQAAPVAPNSLDSVAKKSQLLVVLIYDETCQISCSVVKPMVKELSARPEIKYEEFNTSSKALPETLVKARGMKLERFVSDRTDEVPVVAIFTADGKRLKELAGRKTREVYKDAIDKAIAKVDGH